MSRIDVLDGTPHYVVKTGTREIFNRVSGVVVEPETPSRLVYSWPLAVGIKISWRSKKTGALNYDIVRTTREALGEDSRGACRRREIWRVIEIQGEPSRLRAVADELAKVREVDFVGITRISTATHLAVVNRTLTLDFPEPLADRGAPAKRARANLAPERVVP